MEIGKLEKLEISIEDYELELLYDSLKEEKGEINELQDRGN